MSRKIRKVAVLGSGVMGAGIAAHFANIGLDVLMLDIVPFDLPESERTKRSARNRIADEALKTAQKAKPAPFYLNESASRIATGNFEDDLPKIGDCDWVIEVIVERLDIKQQLFEKVEKFRKKGSLITSNTSGIPIHLMAAGRSDDFRKHFCGTHFFNPPRYMRLLEIIPTPDTDPSVVAFFLHYGDLYLGKETVLCKDTPAFIANRVGVYAMAKVYEQTLQLGLTIEEVDKLTGPHLGRPKTGTFRLGDLIGMDTAVKVMMGVQQNCPHDEQVALFEVPNFLKQMMENRWLGNKTGQGFYKQTKQGGKKEVLGLDLHTLQYQPKRESALASLRGAKQVDDLAKRVRYLFDAPDAGGTLVRESLLGLFAYASCRIPEIADHPYSIDGAMRAGYAWEVGPFEYWDIIGVQRGLELAEAAGYRVADWVKTMLASGNTTFYKSEKGLTHCYDLQTNTYQALPGAESFILLDNYRTFSPVYKNAEATVHDIGDGVLCLEFRSKANSLGGGVVEAINKAIDIAENGDWKGLVIGNNAQNFSVGANLMMIGMMAMQQEFDDLSLAVRTFQNTIMRCRYSSIPVVLATQGYVFGGACEMSMHADSVVAAAESYVGLVEVGVGLIPGGAGTKEFAVRISDSFFEGDVMMPTLIEKFSQIAMAKVATSAAEAFKFGYFLKTKDEVATNAKRNIAQAKAKVLQLATHYVSPVMRTDVRVLGRQGLAALYAAAASYRLGNYISEHDEKIARKIAYVLCGGDLSASQLVSEQYLLDLEREAFLSLCGERKTLERIQYMLTTNKPLRN